MDIKAIQEPVCFYLGKAMHTIAMESPEHKEYKSWLIVAASIGGWAVGFFIASRTFLPQAAAVGLIAICTYAGGRIATDIFSIFTIAATWLLSAGGERGRQLLQAAAPV